MTVEKLIRSNLNTILKGSSDFKPHLDENNVGWY